MKFEYKVVILSLIYSVLCMIGFHFLFQNHLKDIYICQVGIYAIEENKDAKISELYQQGYDAYSYVKDDQYYVLSMISENIDEIEIQANKVNGIIKTYQVDENISCEELLNQLEEGDVND